MNRYIVISFLIHLLISLVFIGDPEYGMLGYILLPFILTNLLGMILIFMGKQIVGARIYLIACFIFIPIGAIGIWGARKIIDQKKKEVFNESLK